ncbi:MAG: integrase core domain-containing protein [Anaeromicrobium sp.]|jgi:putative transposase|uniref:integrase core domain-containing protein n=1 Tax=Anaeromicrobium sp. TaxID=1929132 RepID=UPI0025EE17C7|nr:integrase core domain-containing protein [Anaeromicrobium sp.]MCT4596044.1 integrase core domain-containing protein [Anaeromicrobium sp.]
MKAATFLATSESLGVSKSFSLPRVSNDNPYSKTMSRTLKYAPMFPEKGFPSIENAREWVHEFVNWYNNEHLHSGLKFITPNQRHNVDGKSIMMNKSRFTMKLVKGIQNVGLGELETGNCQIL